jgi:UDP-N-acetylmuramyl pentapeptide phosphotransferase/UDP-N-acetylglucosamine-1-phosphate transferase
MYFEYSIFFIFLIFSFFLFEIIKKKKLLKNNTGDSHQIYSSSKEVPLFGGMFLFLFFLYNFIFINFDKYLIYFLILFFTLGIFSDITSKFNSLARFALQCLLCYLLFFYTDLYITDLRIDFLNKILSTKLIALLFTAFCLAILLNGTNFIDGNNTTVIGYYLIVLISAKLTNLEFLSLNNFFIFFVVVLLILYAMNFSQIIMLGDSGSYLLAFFFGFSLIDHSLNDQNISPYYIATLLWYPAFENLFSIIRKIITNKSPMSADTSHFHHLLFFYIKKKIKVSTKAINTLTGNIINIYNLILISISSFFYTITYFQICAIIFSIFLYITIYILLFKYKKFNKEKM